MKQANITIHPDYKIGKVDERVYGAYLEPIGSWVYGGIWNPGHPEADDLGFRRDVLEAMCEFHFPVIRTPAGNWVSGWEWEHSVGPKESRRRQLDLAWRQYEPNDVGYDEYLEWAKRAGSKAMVTLNLGTDDVKDAFHCVEYTNHPGGTHWSELRKKYGHSEPYDVKTWFLGNEMDGPWQIASWEKDPAGYGKKAHEISKIVKWVNSGSETVVAGSSSPYNSTYPAWDVSVLEQCYESVDYVSIHHYHTAPDGNIDAFLNASAAFEDFIRTTLASCDYMKTKLRSPKTMMLSFDEYGCNFAPQKPLHYGYVDARDLTGLAEFKKETLSQPFHWNDPDKFLANKTLPERREPYSQILGALSMGSVIMTFLRHADRLKIACMTAFMRNALAFDGDHVWKTAMYYVFDQMKRFGQGTSLLPVVNGPAYSIDPYYVDDRRQGFAADGVQAIEAAVVADEEKEEVSVFFLNRSRTDDIEVTLDARGFEGYQLVEHSEMFTADLVADKNTFENPNVIRPSVNSATRMERGKVIAAARRLSWNVVRLAKK